MDRESLRLGMFIAGVLLAAIPVTIGVSMGFLVVRGMREDRRLSATKTSESEEGTP